MLVLKYQDILVDLQVQHIYNKDSRHEHFFLKTEDLSPTPDLLSTSNIQRMSSGLEEYVFKHRGYVETACSVTREDLKVGMGHASNEGTIRNAGQVFEVAIVVVPATTVPCCLTASSQTTQVLYYQNFAPSSIPNSGLSTLERIKWQTYGLKLKEIIVDEDGHAVLRWLDSPLAHFYIAIHGFCLKILPTSQERVDRRLLRKAVKTALDDLKTKYTALFLSSHARKIQIYAPELSRSIASLITSSNDQDFLEECASLLGLHPEDSNNEKMESCIQEKLMEIICMNDVKTDGRDLAPDLFECEPLLHDENCLDDDEGDAEAAFLDF